MEETSGSAIASTLPGSTNKTPIAKTPESHMQLASITQQEHAPIHSIQQIIITAPSIETAPEAAPT